MNSRRAELIQVGGVENKENFDSSILNRARRFVRYPFNLSNEGRQLKEALDKVYESKNVKEFETVAKQLPTVENPRPELFADFELEEDRLNEIFGLELANVQVTKGCSHGCDFCAAGAENKIDMMPFAAVVKMGEALRKNPEVKEMERVRDDFVEQVKQQLGFDIYTWKKENGEHVNIETVYADFVSLYTKHDIQKFAPFPDLWIEFCEDLGQLNPIRTHEIRGWIRRVFTLLGKDTITNYYDSDPFDYQDRNFLHEDGSPANFGDVAEVLSAYRQIHITTAGWLPRNKVAQKAAEKVVALYQQDGAKYQQYNKVLNNPRISVNPTHKIARKDLQKYLEMMKNVIKTLAPIKPEIMMIYNKAEDVEFQEAVVKPIKKYAEEELDLHYRVSDGLLVSTYSGAAVSSDVKGNSEHDVMACMPGYHIWPDGTVAYQAYKGKKKMLDVEKGERPTPTGENLF